jgi:hypothetical protein
MTSVVSETQKCYKTCVASKIDLLMNSLSKFYSVDDNINTLLPIVQGCSKISLRILDWFVTNYCKKHNIIIHNEDKKVIVHLDYKNQLKAYSKKQFDPFCRRSRINFIYGNGDELLTTVGQLNFFRWTIENQLIDYIEENLDDIENDMNSSIKSNKMSNETEVEKGKRRRKRQELSISASKSVSKHNVKIMVEFS